MVIITDERSRRKYECSVKQNIRLICYKLSKITTFGRHRMCVSCVCFLIRMHIYRYGCILCTGYVKSQETTYEKVRLEFFEADFLIHTFPVGPNSWNSFPTVLPPLTSSNVLAIVLHLSEIMKIIVQKKKKKPNNNNYSWNRCATFIVSFKLFMTTIIKTPTPIYNMHFIPYT